MTKHAVEVGYSSEKHQIELVVPHGTKMAELADIIVVIFGGGGVKIPERPCNTCTSGDHFLVRERLQHIVEVDLDQKRASVR
jgi:hypothetical protein